MASNQRRSLTFELVKMCNEVYINVLSLNLLGEIEENYEMRKHSMKRLSASQRSSVMKLLKS